MRLPATLRSQPTRRRIPAQAASGGREGEGTFFGAGGPFNFQYAEDSFFPPNVHGFLRQCVKIKDAPPQPRGWLTPTQRLLLENAASTCRVQADSHYRNGDQHEASVYALEAENIDEILARSSPPEVVLPEPPFARSNIAYRDWMMCLKAVKESLAAAGVAVKEVS